MPVLIHPLHDRSTELGNHQYADSNPAPFLNYNSQDTLLLSSQKILSLLWLEERNLRQNLHVIFPGPVLASSLRMQGTGRRERREGYGNPFRHGPQSSVGQPCDRSASVHLIGEEDSPLAEENLHVNVIPFPLLSRYTPSLPRLP